jgi:hypothetical protein
LLPKLFNDDVSITDYSTETDELWVDNELAGCGVAYLNVFSMTYSAGSV